jgi:hypothetical protein
MDDIEAKVGQFQSPLDGRATRLYGERAHKIAS